MFFYLMFICDGAFFCIALCDISIMLKLLFITFVLVYAWNALKPQSIRVIQPCTSSQWLLTHNDYGMIPAELLPSSVVTSHLLILNFKSTRFNCYTLLVTKGNPFFDTIIRVLKGFEPEDLGA